MTETPGSWEGIEVAVRSAHYGMTKIGIYAKQGEDYLRLWFGRHPERLEITPKQARRIALWLLQHADAEKVMAQGSYQ